MDAHARTPDDLFSGNARYVVPSFQRPYVWEEERQWQPLWEDIERLAEARLEGRKESHFLGAVVLKQESNEPGGLVEWSVIDGQQRLTSIQLMISAIASAAESDGFETDVEWLREVTLHSSKRVTGDRRHRFWPTDVNREAYAVVMRPEGPGEDRQDDRRNTIEEAWTFFRAKARDFAQETDEGEGVDSRDPDGGLRRRYGALGDAVTGQVKLVAIQLGAEDSAQVVFETLNDRGTPLLAMDLVKNALFDRIVKVHSGKTLEDVHDNHWAGQLGDYDYWSSMENVGRISLTRADLFLMHWLTMMTGEVVPSDQLFDRFRKRYLDGSDAPDPLDLLDILGNDAERWRGFADVPSDEAMGSFLSLMSRLDTKIFHPLALRLAGLEDESALDVCFRLMESYVARRMLCGLSTKGYNNLVGDLVASVNRTPDQPAEALLLALLKSQSDTRRWPSDEEVTVQLTARPLYGVLGQTKILRIFEEVELHLRRGPKTENLSELPPKLQIEHVMPQSWLENWPVDDPSDEDQVAFREARINRIGNLTVVADALNSSMSNAPWAAKKEKLNRHSILLVNRELEKTETWDEEAVDARSEYLAALLTDRWRGPQHFIPDSWAAADAEMYPELAEMTEDEVRRVALGSAVYVWELMLLLSDEGVGRLSFNQVADRLDWPDTRLVQVLEQFRRSWREFEGRTPFHFAIDGKGIWWIWMDEAASSVVRQILQEAVDKAEQEREEMIAAIELDSVLELVDLIPERAAVHPGCSAKMFPSTGDKVQLRSVDGRGAGGYFTKRWLFLWWRGRFNGDEEWFRAHLSKKDEVVVNGDGTLRLHVENAADLEVVLKALAGQDEVTLLEARRRAVVQPDEPAED
jgi:hypothetical protein